MVNKLEVEINEKFKSIIEEKWAKSIGIGIMITPAIDKDYWMARVHLYKDQYVQVFPKFSTYGIGFAIEDDDWNTNFPYTISAEKTCEHIWRNHKYKAITKEQTIEAIKLLQEVCKKLTETPI